jgi:hypothetical protein
MTDYLRLILFFIVFLTLVCKTVQVISFHYVYFLYMIVCTLVLCFIFDLPMSIEMSFFVLICYLVDESDFFIKLYIVLCTVLKKH